MTSSMNKCHQFCQPEKVNRNYVKHQKWEAHFQRLTVNTSDSGREPSSTLLAHFVILFCPPLDIRLKASPACD